MVRLVACWILYDPMGRVLDVVCYDKKELGGRGMWEGGKLIQSSAPPNQDPKINSPDIVWGEGDGEGGISCKASNIEFLAEQPDINDPPP